MILLIFDTSAAAEVSFLPFWAELAVPDLPGLRRTFFLWPGILLVSL